MNLEKPHILVLCRTGSCRNNWKKPRPLALSLYREIITDHIWSENRFNYGFKDVSQFHLMTTFLTHPLLMSKLTSTLGFQEI